MFSKLLQITNKEGVSFGTASNVYDVYPITQDKDIFESVIDGLIVEKYADNEVKEYIKSLPIDKRRVATLSLIGDDHVLWSKINDVVKDRKSGYQRLKEIYFLLRDYVKIADVERKKHGEILTPFKELAEPMVKLVDKYDPEFWKNKNHKVLDSSAGYGTFLILSAYKFMIGLKDEFPDEEERFKWIVENCLYYGELQAKSVFSWLVAIDPYNEYKTNIYWGSFLTKDFDEHMKNVWNVESFDLIIQNPPYQTRQEGNRKTQPLWHFFVQKSLDFLSECGYMVMVHPSGWRNVDGIFKETQIKLKEKQILELNINDERKGEEIFGATTGFDFYILKNKDNNSKTNINSDFENGQLNLKDFEFIPSGYFSLFEKLIAYNSDEKVSILHSYSSYETRKKWISRDKSDIFKYPVVYTIQKDKTINKFYSNTNLNGHFGVSKVIWSNGKASMPIVDENGEFGLTQFSYAIVDKENLKNIQLAMESLKFSNLMKSCDMNDGNRFNRKVLSMFKKDFWKEFIYMDTYDLIEKYNKRESKVLIIGCGLSKENEKYDGNHFENCDILIKNDNLYLSDTDISDSYKEFISYDDIKKKFFDINILDTNTIPKAKFDYIDIRNVLHFKKFTKKSINIVSFLHNNNLNSGGQIGIQLLSKSVNSNRDIDEYDINSVPNFITDIKNKFKHVDIYCGFYNNDEYTTLIITKK